MHNFSVYMAHGASAGHQSIFLTKLAATICRNISTNYTSVTFDYMKEIERSGRRRPPAKFNVLVDEYRNEIDLTAPSIVCGKSLGGRVATQCTDFNNVKGIVCFGFPFYPQGKKEKHRLAFLDALTVPCLILQGTRDALGNKEWVTQQALPDHVTVSWVEGADHDFKVLKSIGMNQDDVIADLVARMNKWLVSIEEVLEK